jgi:hypothetical protein
VPANLDYGTVVEAARLVHELAVVLDERAAGAAAHAGGTGAGHSA